MFEPSHLEGLPPEVVSALQSEGAQKAIAAAIEAAKAPILSKRDELLGQLTETKKTVKQIEELGGVEALTQLRTAAQQAEDARKAAELAAAEKNGDAEKLKTHYSEQLSAKEKELNDLRESIKEEKVSAKLNAAIREAKGVPELLEPHLKGRIKSEMVEGTVKLTVLSPNGVPALNTDGKEASLKDLLDEFRGNATFGRAFEAPAASGAGTRPSSASHSSNPWNPASKNVTAQMQLYRTDKATAIRMAAEHGISLT